MRHEHQHHHEAVSWGVAAAATLHCLTGCAIGEVAGMVIGTAVGLSNTATIALAVVLAFLFGYTLTMLPLLRAGIAVGVALPVAFASDSISIAVMEITDNAIMLAIPDAMESGLSDPLFWGALAIALVIAFVIALPVNFWLIGRGQGHAVAHHYHHGDPPAEAPALDPRTRRNLFILGGIAVAATLMVTTLGAALVESGHDDPPSRPPHETPHDG